MITILDRDARGRTRTSWLDSRHSFSFGSYYNPEAQGVGALRVINEDRVAPGAGFAEHAHADMEIISYVIEGALEHRDSLGNGSVIRAGQIQRMTAGTGIRHSEFNASSDAPVHFLQIWILPDTKDLEPSYEELRLPARGAASALHLIGDRHGRDGALRIHQDVELYLAHLVPDQAVTHALRPKRRLWLQVAYGEVLAQGSVLRAGDGALIQGVSAVELNGEAEAEALVFDLR